MIEVREPLANPNDMTPTSIRKAQKIRSVEFLLEMSP
jgi:hypothetical protein